jgi:hypothetical protein
LFTGSAGLCAFLATWVWQLAVVFLLILGAFEIARSRRLTHRPVFLSLAQLTAVAGAALAGAAAVHGWYIGAAAAAHLEHAALPLNVDWGHLQEDAAEMWERFHFFGAWIALPLSLGTAMTVALKRKTVDGDLAELATALPLLSLLNAIAVTAASWTRINGHSPRYLALTDFFAIIGLCAGLLALLPSSWRDRRLANAAMSGAVILFSVIALPANPPSRRIPILQQLMTELAAKAPGVPLLGSYWGSYPFVDGTAPNPLVPVTQELDMNRTPWTVQALRNSRSVIVSHVLDQRCGSADHPVPFLFEYGTLLQLS